MQPSPTIRMDCITHSRWQCWQGSVTGCSALGERFTRPRRCRFTKMRPRSHRLAWSSPERPRLACRTKLAAGGGQVNLDTWKSPSRSLSLVGLISHETQDFRSHVKQLMGQMLLPQRSVPPFQIAPHHSISQCLALSFPLTTHHQLIPYSLLICTAHCGLWIV